MNKKISTILTLIAFVMAVFCLTVLLSGSHKNGFNRQLHFKQIIETGLYNFKDNDSVKSLVFISDSDAYFTTQDPAKLIIIDLFTRKKISIIISNPLFLKNVPKGNFCMACGPDHFYLFKINSKRYLRLNMRDNTISEYSIPRFAFTRCVLSTANNIVFRRYNSAIKDQQFCSMSLSDTIILNEHGVSERHHDWGMRTDGILLYDQYNKQNIYVYYKKNSYMVMDSCLRLTNIGKTILNYSKPVRSSISKIHDAKNKVEIVTESVPVTVSVLAADVYNGNLYICSGVKADNENWDIFNKNSVIDVYSVMDTKYLGSFYLPRYKGKQLWSFMIYKNSFFAAYETGLKKFDLPTILN